MGFHIGNRMINVYGELGNVIKTNTSRLKEATNLFSQAVSLETTSSMKAHWYAQYCNTYLSGKFFEAKLFFFHDPFFSTLQITPLDLLIETVTHSLGPYL